MTHFLKEVQRAEEELLVGNVILYPTDTIWGLGCDAENEKAVQKIYEIKQRPSEKPFILLVADEQMLKQYVTELPEKFTELRQQQQRPTTYVFENAQNLTASLMREDKTIAIRIPEDEFCQRLIRNFGRAIVSTSANLSGQNSGSSLQDVPDEILQKVDYVVNWRQDEQLQSAPSRIVKLQADGTTQVIRD
ncbi:MAG: threonylcarbamoyl-AMP synthase [Hymenobacteraceae bacterium]|nr:threonylcarbamoyl-AMP synthase [Hymenobacteraceae bacterium]MDX5395161.1 threonylcarbamoyl-AMP synthase [Hymenobacteraceae bacterium]MDX5444024.1 threonylcarbamoyl-AMP synthase [Hymenobacteraceae bacterium]MDX5511198.1 threonylcarbamoyl-AMP synthase [Hymenobacteraceae bacterium]